MNLRNNRRRMAASLFVLGIALVLGAATPSFANGKHSSPPPNPSGCGEDSFLGSLIPSDGSTVGPGATIGAVYQDETPLNTSTVSFTVDGVAVTPVLTNLSGGKEKYSTRITYTLPTNFAPGVHQARLYAEDTDQNKTGGDCGVATWSFTVAAPAPSPSPTASPSPSPSPSSSPTTAPPPSQTPTITTRVLGSEISRPATVAAANVAAAELPATGQSQAVLLVLGLALIGWGVALRLPKPAKQQ
jgi:LPXTG-motif cell wall-anchored protein